MLRAIYIVNDVTMAQTLLSAMLLLLHTRLTLNLTPILTQLFHVNWCEGYVLVHGTTSFNQKPKHDENLTNLSQWLYAFILVNVSQ